MACTSACPSAWHALPQESLSAWHALPLVIWVIWLRPSSPQANARMRTHCSAYNTPPSSPPL